MKSSGLIVAAVVLAALSGILYWSNHHTPAKDSAKSSAETLSKIFTFNEPDIAKIEIRKKGADQVVVTKDASGKWKIASPRVLEADQEAVSALLSTLSSLSSDRLIEDKANNLNQYGLTDPVLEVDVTDKQSKTQKLLIGDDTPTGSAVYATLTSDSRVFTLATYNKTSLDKSPKDLRDKRLLTIESDKISRVELITKNQDIEFGRTKDEWQILKPMPLRADGTQVGELIRKLTDATMDLSGSDVDTKKTASAFASGTPVATAKVTGESGTQQLEVRKTKEDYYSKSSVVDGAYKVSSDLGHGLDKSLDDFRNKKLFDFSFDEPNKVEIRDASKALILTRAGQDWWSDGKKMDATSVRLFVDKIRDLSANRFVNSGFAAALMEITVTSKDGKRIEKVLISKNAGNYVGKRENEPALYELDTKAVEELQKSTGNVKAAVVPAK
jgi:hypothetical protein